MSHEQSPQDHQPEMIQLPEELMTPELQNTIEQRGMEAKKVHIDMAAQAIAQDRILRNQEQLERASAEAVNAAQQDNARRNIAG